MVHLSVTQKKSWRWEAKPEAGSWTSAMPAISTTMHLRPEKNKPEKDKPGKDKPGKDKPGKNRSEESMPEENMPEEMELPISADGEVHLSIPISERTESLTVDVRRCPLVVLVQLWFRSWFWFPSWSLFLCSQAYFGDSYTSLHVYRDYTSPSHSYLGIQRPLAPLEVSWGMAGRQRNNNDASQTAEFTSLCASAPRPGGLGCAASRPQQLSSDGDSLRRESFSHTRTPGTLVILDGFNPDSIHNISDHCSQQLNFSSHVPSACVKVKSRGQLVSAGTAPGPALALLPEFSWAPRASLIVYCVHPSGEIVSDAVQLHVVPPLSNWVSRWSPTSQWRRRGSCTLIGWLMSAPRPGRCLSAGAKGRWSQAMMSR